MTRWFPLKIGLIFDRIINRIVISVLNIKKQNEIVFYLYYEIIRQKLFFPNRFWDSDLPLVLWMLYRVMIIFDASFCLDIKTALHFLFYFILFCVLRKHQRYHYIFILCQKQFCFLGVYGIPQISYWGEYLFCR